MAGLPFTCHTLDTIQLQLQVWQVLSITPTFILDSCSVELHKLAMNAVIHLNSFNGAELAR